MPISMYHLRNETKRNKTKEKKTKQSKLSQDGQSGGKCYVFKKEVKASDNLVRASNPLPN